MRELGNTPVTSQRENFPANSFLFSYNDYVSLSEIKSVLGFEVSIRVDS